MVWECQKWIGYGDEVPFSTLIGDWKSMKIPEPH